MEEQSIEKLVEENKLLKEKINELTEHLKNILHHKEIKNFMKIIKKKL